MTPGGVYKLGDAQGLSQDLYAPDGEPWCSYRAGLHCRNERRCLNPQHRIAAPEDAIRLLWWLSGGWW